jgi:ribosomal-protein-alanine N-acetyltransferase
MNGKQLDTQPHIRPATEADVDRILEIERLCFGSEWTRRQFVSSLKELFYVFELDEVIGFLVACTCEVARRAIIMRIAVHPDYRHRGIATKLINAALEEFRREDLKCVELDVDIVKNGAIKLYEKVGFKVMKVATVDYDEDTSFLIMKLVLASQDVT